ncbi:hypothetical protein DASC09_012200 [Saccharomycopsis crataegensis]|uniref:Complex I-B14.7 n=1 Tax=Saccharomycopsis crataegensis TaxID=43959 RepID=A0AAV5QG24_9ASCO|nr:hypothetical protein DASC09_012200 [Saccharomycopsis crataegensis]
MSEAQDQQPKSTKLYTPTFRVQLNKPFQPVDAIEVATNAGIGGLLVSSVFAAGYNSLNKSQAPAFHRIRLSGVLVGAVTVSAAAYSFIEALSGNLRQKNDGVNAFYGGLVSGSIIGSVSKNVAKTVGCGFAFGCIMGLVSWGGQSVTGLGKDSPYDSIDKSEPVPKLFGEKQGVWDAAYRRPMSQTIEMLGEDSIALKK